MVLSMKRYGFLNLLERSVLNRVNENGRKAIKILIAVVLGALLLFTLYKLFGDTVLPKLEQSINDMFGYGGAVDQLG
ncbi:DUF6133 family protein [Caproiciproducens sp. CPB-2]|nr:DUF6133 family protein [Caproiciproducens sp. CPB-2]MDF1493709.1 DUF6133 family protein [Caproiciproducens sp. CPB-2]